MARWFEARSRAAASACLGLIAGCSGDPESGAFLFATTPGDEASPDLRQAVSAVSDPSVEGQWSAGFSVPIEPVHAIVLPTNKLLLLDVTGGAVQWNAANGLFMTLTPPTYNVFCSGHALMADGKVLVFGGRNNVSSFGAWNASLFDGVTRTWTMLPDMNAGRWYPTSVTLANGDVLVVGGSITDVTLNTLPQVWSVATGTFRDLTGAQLAMGLYPRLHLLPGGKVLMASPDKVYRTLDTAGAGQWTNVGVMNLRRMAGSSVQYEDGKIVSIGGSPSAGVPPTATAEIIDMSAATPQWTLVPPMASPRAYLNATLLPDGQVLVTGGSSGVGFDDATQPVLPAELWDPATQAWTTMASLSTYRGYHATAVLLPDGRVWSGGGYEKPPGARSLSGEIYSPPYLFKGTRPVLTFAPGAVDYGQTFGVATPSAASVTQVAWISLPSVTHDFNMNQRRNVLAFSPGVPGRLNVTAPTDPNVAPPGHWMLFLLDAQGVPSMAKVVRLGSGIGSSPIVPASDRALQAVSGGAGVTLSWNDTATNELGYKLERATDLVTGIWSAFVTTGPGATSTLDPTVASGSTYYYRLRAFNAAGHSPYSLTATVVVP